MDYFWYGHFCPVKLPHSPQAARGKSLSELLREVTGEAVNKIVAVLSAGRGTAPEQHTLSPRNQSQ